MVRMYIERTKKGPAMWEKGGGLSECGESTIIAGKDGRPKKPIRRGCLANCRHALIPVEEGDYIINAFHNDAFHDMVEDCDITIYRITGFEEYRGERYAVAEYFNDKCNYLEQICYDYPEWEEPLPAFLEDAVRAAMEKATCYHCREPHFAII